MRVTIIGAGAVGGWLAATLIRGGAQVALVARGATLDRIRAQGLTLLAGDARETYRVHLNDLGDPSAKPVPKDEYDRLRQESLANGRLARAA